MAEKEEKKVQGRVITGSTNQDKVAKVLQEKYNVEIVSIAPRGSQQPDVVFKINNNQYNAEIKGLASLNNDTAVFDISCSRKNNNFPVLNEMAKVLLQANNLSVPREYESSSFVWGIDYKRLYGKKTIGFPKDEGVSARSGSIPSDLFSSSSSQATSKAYEILMDHFKEKNDTFFCLALSNKIIIWYVGEGVSPLPGIDKFSTIDISNISLNTYGTDYYRKDNPEKGIKKGDLTGVMRIAFKIKFK